MSQMRAANAEWRAGKKPGAQWCKVVANDGGEVNLNIGVSQYGGYWGGIFGSKDTQPIFVKGSKELAGIKFNIDTALDAGAGFGSAPPAQPANSPPPDDGYQPWDDAPAQPATPAYENWRSPDSRAFGVWVSQIADKQFSLPYQGEPLDKAENALINALYQIYMARRKYGA